MEEEEEKGAKEKQEARRMLRRGRPSDDRGAVAFSGSRDHFRQGAASDPR